MPKTKCYGTPADDIANPALTPSEHRKLRTHIKGCKECSTSLFLTYEDDRFHTPWVHTHSLPPDRLQVITLKKGS